MFENPYVEHFIRMGH